MTRVLEDLIIGKDVKKTCKCAFFRMHLLIRSDENTCPTLKSGKHQIDSLGKQ